MRKCQVPLKWIAGEKIIDGLPLFTSLTAANTEVFLLMDLIDIFFNEELFEFILQQSKFYCVQKTGLASISKRKK